MMSYMQAKTNLRQSDDYSHGIQTVKHTSKFVPHQQGATEETTKKMGEISIQESDRHIILLAVELYSNSILCKMNYSLMH